MLRLLHRRNRLIHSHIDCFRFGPVCRLRAITYTTTSLDDDENNDNNGGGSEYVIKNVPSAPISSLFESSDINKWNDRRNNKKNQSRRRPQQYNWRSSSKSRKNKKRFTNVGDINNDLLWHMTNKPSRVGNSSSSHDMTKAKNENDDVLNVNNSQEKESDGNSMLSEIFPIKSAVTAVTSIFKRVTTAIGFTSTFNNNIEAENIKQSVLKTKSPYSRKRRQYQCPDCNYQVTRWVILKSKMRNCAHCSTTTASILNSDSSNRSAARKFEVYVDSNGNIITTNNDANFTRRYSNNKKGEELSGYTNNKNMNLFLVPQKYRTKNGTLIASHEQQKEHSDNSEKNAKRNKQMIKQHKQQHQHQYQCEECGQESSVWKIFRKRKKYCKRCTTPRAGIDQKEFLKVPCMNP